ncbi:hypothetical protein [Acidovorax cavernicola]|uniref:Uncharacterized protein n=1 Tax=Acidovorax cavernicola TaxID=1675792 RepID=A0A9X8D1J7_9BURK|nr:hypothetical protein [Acidovorax cavernicola]RIX76274.1 hypothetical protein D3H34_22935 [Acidovorax cavernicola]
MNFLYGMAAALMCALGGQAAAQATHTQTTKAGDAGADACVEVTVNGERTPSYACLTQKLQPESAARGPGDAQPGMASEAIVQRPSNQLGLFNRAATGHRMGNTFGTSVYPQRPPPVVPSSPLIPAR